MFKESVLRSAEIFEFLRGFIILNTVLLPVSVLTVLFIGIMGGGSPEKMSPWKSMGISAGFVYGLPSGVLAFCLGTGKVLDFIFGINSLSSVSVSWFTVCIASVVLTFLAEVFVDNSFQLKKGNYKIIIYGILAVMIFMISAYFSGRIPLPWISGWFR